MPWRTTTEVSRDLNVSKHNLRQWVRQGRIPGAVKLPSGVYRLPADAVERLLQPVSASAASEASADAG